MRQAEVFDFDFIRRSFKFFIEPFLAFPKELSPYTMAETDSRPKRSYVASPAGYFPKATRIAGIRQKSQ
jgi:hypothetical protein